MKGICYEIYTIWSCSIRLASLATALLSKPRQPRATNLSKTILLCSTVSGSITETVSLCYLCNLGLNSLAPANSCSGGTDIHRAGCKGKFYFQFEVGGVTGDILNLI